MRKLLSSLTTLTVLGDKESIANRKEISHENKRVNSRAIK